MWGCEKYLNASVESDFEGKFDLSLGARVRGMESDEFFLRQTVCVYRRSGENKVDQKWQWP